jgi:hypothetical protein
MSHCKDCRKRSYADAKAAIVALSRAVGARAMGDRRAECRFYPCPAANGFHLTSEVASTGDRSKYVLLSAMVVKQYDRVLSAA